MNKGIISFFAAVMIVSFQSAGFAAPIDLSTWTAVGSGNWEVQGGGTSVLQKVNTSNGTYFLSPETYMNKLFEGSFGVETTSDDDFIGFVFGYNQDTTSGLKDYYLLDWKQNRQSSGGFASDGFTLSRIQGSDSNVNFWTHTGTDITVIDTLYGDDINDEGWADNTVYNFALDLTTSNINISIDGREIFDVDGTYNAGQFGFYNYSQQSVRYMGFEETQSPSASTVPEPATMVLFGSGLLGLMGVRRKK